MAPKQLAKTNSCFLFVGSGDIDGLPKVSVSPTPTSPEPHPPMGWARCCGRGSPLSSLQNSPNNISGISNPPGTPRDDGELGGNFLHSFQNDNVSALPSSFPPPNAPSILNTGPPTPIFEPPSVLVMGPLQLVWTGHSWAHPSETPGRSVSREVWVLCIRE